MSRPRAISIVFGILFLSASPALSTSLRVELRDVGPAAQWVSFGVLLPPGAGPGTPRVRVLREASERQRDGAIPGALHTPYGGIKHDCGPAGALAGLARSGPVLLYCAVGERSTLACEIAAECGLMNVAHIPGGFKAWKAAGGAIESVA